VEGGGGAGGDGGGKPKGGFGAPPPEGLPPVSRSQSTTSKVKPGCVKEPKFPSRSSIGQSPLSCTPLRVIPTLAVGHVARASECKSSPGVHVLLLSLSNQSSPAAGIPEAIVGTPVGNGVRGEPGVTSWDVLHPSEAGGGVVFVPSQSSKIST